MLKLQEKQSFEVNWGLIWKQIIVKDHLEKDAEL
jgi:hypothetical protein